MEGSEERVTKLRWWLQGLGQTHQSEYTRSQYSIDRMEPGDLRKRKDWLSMQKGRLAGWLACWLAGRGARSWGRAQSQGWKNSLRSPSLREAGDSLGAFSGSHRGFPQTLHVFP